jgi:glycosyltransferase involved in cell wall biosynthesis
VEAFAELRRRTAARMIIAGEGPLRAQVLATIRRLGVASDVELLGSVSHEEIKSLYDSASVLLFTSLRESFGAPFLEALARGVPAVALNMHGIADAEVGSAAVKVELTPDCAQLPARLADALETVLSDGNWQARSVDGVRFASQWRWPAKADQAVSIYSDVLR